MGRKVFSPNPIQRERMTEQLRELLIGYPEIAFAYLYGSFAENLPFHDVDIGIYLSEIGQEEATSFGLALSQTLSKEVKVPLDVRVLNFAPISFVYQVVRGILMLERNEALRVSIVEDAIRKYLDIKPLLHRGIKEAFGS
ncbi:MAG: nucleotidyltransferase domain-containing protein [Desulfobacterota bacterium]|nr:nucleotidyltransferase domain-containing protein [Thermodesulfobacteriota bacterium]